MTRFTTLAAACAVTALVAILPLPATSAQNLERNGLTLYERCWQAIGADCGRNIQEDGLADPARPATGAEIAAWRDRLHAVVDPPAPVPASEETAPAEPSYSGGAASSTVMCESGGDYGANTGNGYYGGYQFDSGTWDAYGDSAYPEASDAPPAVQDAAAASVPYDAWPNC